MQQKLLTLLGATICAGLSVTTVAAEDAEAAIVETIDQMTMAFAKGDVDTVMTAYEGGATVMAMPGQPVRGEAELRDMFADFIAAGVNFTYGGHEVVVAGDIGLHLMKWTAATPEGTQTALSVAVLRRQPAGGWQMVIDHPFGDAVMANVE